MATDITVKNPQYSFESLIKGQWFVYMGELYIKINNIRAVDLKSGYEMDFTSKTVIKLKEVLIEY